VLRTMADRLAAVPGTNTEAEVRLRHADGTYRWLHLIGTDLTDNPHVRGTVWNARDVTEAKRLRDELRHQATHDPLTGLANRALLDQRLREADPADQVGVLLVDLDGFKQINDVHGHQAGDRVLVTVAQRLVALLGTTGTAARLGGDEFAVVVPNAGIEEIEALAERITAEIIAPILVTDSTFGDTFVAVGASVGAAAGIPASADKVLHDADRAMYRRKNARRAPMPAA
jgi:diguanylate cyclase (GGDEF)-like protein